MPQTNVGPVFVENAASQFSVGVTDTAQVGVNDTYFARAFGQSVVVEGAPAAVHLSPGVAGIDQIGPFILFG